MSMRFRQSLRQEARRSCDQERYLLVSDLLTPAIWTGGAYSAAAAAFALAGRAGLSALRAGRLATIGLASAAIFASLANEAGDAIAGSDRLLRSGVFPPPFSPAMNWP